MTARTLPRIAPVHTPKPRFLDALARRSVLGRLAMIDQGRLTLRDAGETHTFGVVSASFPIDVTIDVHDPRFWSDLAFGGSIGAGEAWMQGWWTTPDLTALVRLMTRNRAALDGIDGGWSRVTAPLQRGLHWLNRNTRAGSRRNIAAHYDLGNDFFALFLDPSMMYSSAIFERDDMSLAEAQAARLERICRKLELRPGDHLLEIGTGWGGMAIHAARHHGCRVTTTTLSREQHAEAVRRVAAAGLSDRVTVLLRDYRDLDGVYDKLVSIEMIEAVGHRYFDTYFRTCAGLLAPDGLMLLQSITIADQRYAAARDGVDFIQRHIFPGSCIPSISAIMTSIARASDLRLLHLEDFGPHYATTLRLWREAFVARLDDVRAMGYPDTFIRAWLFYLGYCEGGFEERAIGDAQFLFAKPANRRAPLVPGITAGA